MIRAKGTVKDKESPGYARILEVLGSLGHLTLGVQGKEAVTMHPDGRLLIGQVAAIHELGLSGHHRTKRSWLSSWIDAHAAEMHAQAADVMRAILAGTLTRKKGFEKLGYMWVQALRENITNSGIAPPLSPTTVAIKGHSVPLLDTGSLRDSITYKVFLPRWKRVKGGVQGASVEMRESQSAKEASARIIPPESSAVQGSPQPPDGPMFGPKERKLKKFGPRKPKTFGPKERRGKKFGPKERRGKKAGPKQASFNVRRPRGFRKGKYVPGVRTKPARRPKGKGHLKPKRQARGRSRRFRKARKASWLLAYLKRLAARVLQPSGGVGDGRNHGFTGIVRTDRTGLAGRRRPKW
jgi:hypothetical protein